MSPWAHKSREKLQSDPHNPINCVLCFHSQFHHTLNSSVVLQAFDYVTLWNEQNTPHVCKSVLHLHTPTSMHKHAAHCTSPLSPSHTCSLTLGTKSCVCASSHHNGHVELSARLRPACLAEWVKARWRQHTKDSIQTISWGSNDSLMHTQTHTLTPAHPTATQTMSQYYSINPLSGGCLRSACLLYKASHWATTSILWLPDSC